MPTHIPWLTRHLNASLGATDLLDVSDSSLSDSSLSDSSLSVDSNSTGTVSVGLDSSSTLMIALTVSSSFSCFFLLFLFLF